MYPCLLHESTGAFGGDFGYNVDTRVAIQLRQKLFEEYLTLPDHTHRQLHADVRGASFC